MDLLVALVVVALINLDLRYTEILAQYQLEARFIIILVLVKTKHYDRILLKTRWGLYEN